MLSAFAYHIFLLFFISILVAEIESRGSCKGICCPGKNSSCFAFNSTTGRRCYCDGHCSRTQDCCLDYLSQCRPEPPINCVLSNWQRWSYCSNNCGSGFEKRYRKVLINPKGSGQRCGSVSESRSCRGVLCPAQSQTHRHRKTNYYSKASSSVVRLLPDRRSLSHIYRQYSHKHGIRRHIYLRNLWLNNETETENSKTPYCSFYRITMTIGNCDRLHRLSHKERANWSEHSIYLATSNKICITCYPQNQNNKLKNQCAGSESPHKESRWRAVMSDDCHGLFTLLSRKEKCKCPQPSFLMI